MDILPSRILGKGQDYKGFVYLRHNRIGDVAVYGHWDGDNILTYEVIIIRVSPERDVILKGKKVHFNEKEVYPSKHEWGVFGWTFFHLKEALTKQQEVLAMLKFNEYQKQEED